MKYATRENFVAICSRNGMPNDDAGSIWRVLDSFYSEEHRHYHNWNHIDAMLGYAASLAVNNDSLKLAIWFHDSVYDPRRQDNEEQSAAFFKKCVGAAFDSDLVETVERLILATERKPRSGRADEDLLIDIDLAILSAPTEIYRTYSSAIRKEYRHVSEADFVAGRKAILREFLGDRIYVTPHFQKREGEARMNLQRELDELGMRNGSADLS